MWRGHRWVMVRGPAALLLPALFAVSGVEGAVPGATRAASLHVRVVSAEAEPVADAEIRVGRDDGHGLWARSDSAGEAHFPEVPEGMVRLAVRRLGLAPQQLVLRVAAGENRYTVRLEAHALSLTGVRVVGSRSYTARLDDFERRRVAGAANAVVTREQIDRLGAMSLSRTLRGLAGLRIGDSLGSVVAISTRGAKPTLTAGRNQFALVQCVLRVAVDGVLLPPFASLDQIVPGDVHGVEVYFGPARLPPELAGLRTDNWCGVVAIWTRGG